MNKLIAALAIGSAALLACGTEPQTSAPRPSGALQKSGTFVLDVNPQLRTATFRTNKQAVYGVRPFGEDGSTLTNPAGTIQAVTLTADPPGVNGCSLNQNCFTVQLTNFTGAFQGGVYMAIDSVTPATGRGLSAGTQDPVPMGVIAALGGRNFGDLADGASSAVLPMVFDVPDSSPYAVAGSFWGDAAGVAPVVVAYSFGQTPYCGTFCYFDELHNINTTGNPNNNSSVGAPALGQLVDGIRGTNNWGADNGFGNAQEWVGWFPGASGPVVDIDFVLAAQSVINSVTIGMNNFDPFDVAQPSQFDVSFSNDGVTYGGTQSFVLGANMAAIPTGERADLTFNLGGVSAAFVRVEAVTQLNAWIFLDEVGFN